MKLAVLMDPPHRLIPYKDTTLAMIKSAKDLGWFCGYFTEETLCYREGEVHANLFTLDVPDEKVSQWAEIKDLGDHILDDFDIVLMRKDPPFTMEYIYCTYFLDLLQSKGVLVANNPQALRTANEKFFTLNFPQCCPPTLVSKNLLALKAFWEKHKQVIFKPLAGMGGSSVFHVGEKGENLAVILEVLTEQQTVTVMAQAYIPEIITQGDKRILVLFGEPVPYALARIPKQGDIRGNLAAGASAKVVPINERDKWLCQQLAPTFKRQGLYFVGIDVIGDYLTEINVTSPTCLREIERETGLTIAKDYLQGLASNRV